MINERVKEKFEDLENYMTYQELKKQATLVVKANFGVWCNTYLYKTPMGKWIQVSKVGFMPPILSHPYDSMEQWVSCAVIDSDADRALLKEIRGSKLVDV